MPAAENFAFVLARTRQPGNIGSAARALKNMGFEDLRLVAPLRSGRSRAAVDMAVHAGDVLESARVTRTLAEALDDATLTVGTTCRGGLYRAGTERLREASADLANLARKNRIAIVFGPEDTGLTNQELALCQRLITIETGPGYRSLNLAQAVMLVAYQLRLALDSQSGAKPDSPEFAPAREVDAMLERMAQALVAIGFLPADNPEHIMFALRGMLGRSGVAARELEILNGIASQMRWVAEGGHATLARKRGAGKKLR